MAYSSNLVLWNAALLGIGESEVAVGDGSAEGNLFVRRFDPLVRAQLSKHNTGFARKTTTLVRQGPTGNASEVAYDKPVDLLKIAKVTRGGALVSPYQVRGRSIVTPVDATDLTLHYVWNAPITLWTPDFAEAMVLRCQQVLFTFYERHTDARDKRIEADDLFLTAQAVDRNAETPIQQDLDPLLVRAHRGFGGAGRNA